MEKDFSKLVDDDTNVVKPATHSKQDTSDDAKQIELETYTDEEIRDVNAITVTIPDTTIPIVVLFGSQASGKTLALLRMIRFLESNEYQVVPEEVFRPQSDKHYTKMCAGLKTMAYSSYAPGGTDVISFMLVKVLDSVGNPVCQILEAPGEHYFDGSANLTFPTYINAIRTAPNRKVWVFFVEQNWGHNQQERDLYAQKIKEMQGLISDNDKVVFLFNKSDKLRHQYAGQRPNIKVFFKNIAQQYPGIFSRYENHGLLKLLYGQYNFKAICFSSGIFNSTNDDKEVWTPENDSYCQDFWNAIMK
jgi:hypothetical protein